MRLDGVESLIRRDVRAVYGTLVLSPLLETQRKKTNAASASRIQKMPIGTENACEPRSCAMASASLPTLLR